jgi:RHS repeat-associated protein
VAHYEYDAYGNVDVASGTYNADNPFRFSAKWFDDESGLGYWGYRYYSPDLGRWLGRDPLSEWADILLYRYASNAAIHFWDALGLLTEKECKDRWASIYTLFSTTRTLRDTFDAWITYDTQRMNTLDRNAPNYRDTLAEILKDYNWNRRRSRYLNDTLNELFDEAALANWMINEGCKCEQARNVTSGMTSGLAAFDAVNSIPSNLADPNELMDWLSKQYGGYGSSMDRLRESLKSLLDKGLFYYISNDCCAEYSKVFKVSMDLYRKPPTIDTLGRETTDDRYQVCR